jgi:hypothetical protein
MKFFLAFFFLIVSGILSAQSTLSIRLMTISAHPCADENLALHKKIIDENGYFTFEPGIIASYDRFLIKNLTFRASTSIISDRFNLLSAYSQIMLKLKLFKYYKHSLYAGIGPSVFYESNKTKIENFVNEDRYKLINNTMIKIAWISGMIEYNYHISKKTDFALTLNHTHFRSFGISIGGRFVLPDPDGKGCDCPSFR